MQLRISRHAFSQSLSPVFTESKKIANLNSKKKKVLQMLLQRFVVPYLHSGFNNTFLIRANTSKPARKNTTSEELIKIVCWHIESCCKYKYMLFISDTVKISICSCTGLQPFTQLETEEHCVLSQKMEKKAEHFLVRKSGQQGKLQYSASPSYPESDITSQLSWGCSYWFYNQGDGTMSITFDFLIHFRAN